MANILSSHQLQSSPLSTAQPKVPEAEYRSAGTRSMSCRSSGTDLSIPFRPLEEHRQELTNTVAGRGNEGRGRGEDGEEAEKLLEHLDGLLRIRRSGRGKETRKERRKTRMFLCISVGSVAET